MKLQQQGSFPVFFMHISHSDLTDLYQKSSQNSIQIGQYIHQYSCKNLNMEKLSLQDIWVQWILYRHAF